jgi:hypothetical protein
VSRRAPAWLASTLVVTIGLGVTVAVDRSGGTRTPSAASARSAGVAPLSAADRKALVADAALIESLPEAFSEVPQAAADVAGTDLETARATLDRIAALATLVKAVDGQAPALTLLISRYRALVSTGARPDSATLAEALETLQAVEGDVVPAVRVVALKRGRQISAAGALTAVERDPRTATLGRLLADWSEAYGALVLMEQAAAG